MDRQELLKALSRVHAAHNEFRSLAENNDLDSPTEQALIGIIKELTEANADALMYCFFKSKNQEEKIESLIDTLQKVRVGSVN